MADIIATELDAKTISGNTSLTSVTVSGSALTLSNTRCTTKIVAKAIGCLIENDSSYTDNQLVCLKDLKPGTHPYEIKYIAPQLKNGLYTSGWHTKYLKRAGYKELDTIYEFPTSYMSTSSNFGYCTGSTSSLSGGVFSCCRSGVIYATNNKNIYKSADGGKNWTSIATVPSDTKLSTFPPFLFVDATYCYYVYVVMSGTSQSLRIFRVTLSNNSTSTTTVITNSSIASSGGNDSGFITYIGMEGICQPSPHGLVCIRYTQNDMIAQSTSGQNGYYILDIPNMKISSLCKFSRQAACMYNTRGVGQWVNDGSTYGAFFIQAHQVQTSSVFTYFWIPITARITTNGQTVVANLETNSNITTKLNSAISGVSTFTVGYRPESSGTVACIDAGKGYDVTFGYSSSTHTGSTLTITATRNTKYDCSGYAHQVYYFKGHPGDPIIMDDTKIFNPNSTLSPETLTDLMGATCTWPSNNYYHSYMVPLYV